MEICSITFLFPILFLSVFYQLLPSLFWRRLLLGVVNIFCLGLLLETWVSALLFFVFLSTGYIVAKILRKYGHRSLLLVYIVLFVGSFVCLKQ